MVFDGYAEQSTTCHEHNRRQTGNVSAAIIVIAENAQAHRDQPAFFSNKKNETSFISLLTTHEISRCTHCMRLNSLRMVKRINLVGLPLEIDIFIRKESRLSRPGETFSMTEATSSKPLVIQFIHA